MKKLLHAINSFPGIYAFLVFFLLLIPMVRAQGVTEEWRQLYTSQPESYLNNVQLATDANANVYVAANEADAGTSYVIKYSGTGQELWIVKIPDFLVMDIAADAGEGLFVTGSNALSSEMETLRLSKSDGSIVWQETYDGRFARDVAYAIETNAAGEVYVVGESAGRLTSGTVLIKYDSSSGNELWTSLMFEPVVIGAPELFNYIGTALELDGQGGIYVAGRKEGRQEDYWIAKFKDDDGSLQWSTVYGNRADVFERIYDLSVDAENGVYVTGESYGTMSTLKLDPSNGAVLWESSPERVGIVGQTSGNAIVHNSQGVFITGEISSDAASGSQMITIKYDAETGAEEWAVLTDNDSGVDIALDAANALYTLSDMLVLTKYNGTDGTVIWTTGPGEVEGRGGELAVSPEGNIVVTGTTSNSQLLTIKYSQQEAGPCYASLPVRLSLPPHAVKVGETVLSTARFGGYIPGDAHNIRWVWGDGTAPVEAYFATGDDHITGEHVYQQPGIYRVSLDFSQSCLAPQSYDFEEWVVVYDPMAGFITGGGQINSPQTALPWMSQQLNAQYSFTVKYNKATATTPQGHTQLNLRKQGVFRSTSIEWLVISGDQAIWQGTGTLNGKGSYGFIASAHDAGGTGADDASDQLRIRIWDKSAGNELVYDNFQAAGDLLDLNSLLPDIARGQVVIHPGKAVAGKASAQAQQVQFYNYPNTFTDKTTISFTTAKTGTYTLEVYDGQGKLVKQLATGIAQAGEHYSYELDGTSLPKGLYIARLATPEGTQTIRMLLQR